jgi:hypothetical protein
MKGTLVWVVALAAAACAWAGEGDLRPAACDPQEALGAQRHYASGSQMRTAPEGSGTVSPRATVITFRIGQRVWRLAVDASKPKAERPNVVRLDFENRGTFRDAPVVPLKVERQDRRPGGTQLAAQIGPKDVKVTRDGRSLAVRVLGHYYHSGGYRYAWLSLGAALEGECRFGEKVYAVRLIDGDGNLKFTDATAAVAVRGRVFQRLRYGDTLAVYPRGTDKPRDALRYHVGHPVLVDGTWYDVSVSADQKRITARPAKLRIGKLQVGQQRWSATLLQGRRVLRLTGGPEPMPVPIGRHLVIDFTQWSAPGKDGRRAMLERSNYGKTLYATVPADGVGRCVAGTPLSASIRCRLSDGRRLQMSLNLVDASGADVGELLLTNGKRPKPPTIRVLDATGKQVHTAALEYG